MMEDSKRLAEAGSSGMAWDVRFAAAMEEKELQDTLTAWMGEMVRGMGRDRVLGHIKAVFRCPQRWVRLNFVDPRLPIDVQSSLSGPVASGRMKAMAALVGSRTMRSAGDWRRAPRRSSRRRPTGLG